MKDIFYSVSLIIPDYINENIEKRTFIYEKIIYNLKNNSSLIKEGGVLNVYYVTSKLDGNVKEGYRLNKDFGSYKWLILSISENINLNKSISIKTTSHSCL